MYVSGGISNFMPRLHQLCDSYDAAYKFYQEFFNSGYSSMETTNKIHQWERELQKCYFCISQDSLAWRINYFTMGSGIIFTEDGHFLLGENGELIFTES